MKKEQLLNLYCYCPASGNAFRTVKALSRCLCSRLTLHWFVHKLNPDSILDELNPNVKRENSQPCRETCQTEITATSSLKRYTCFGCMSSQLSLVQQYEEQLRLPKWNVQIAAFRLQIQLQGQQHKPNNSWDLTQGHYFCRVSVLPYIEVGFIRCIVIVLILCLQDHDNYTKILQS